MPDFPGQPKGVAQHNFRRRDLTLQCVYDPQQGLVVGPIVPVPQGNIQRSGILENPAGRVQVILKKRDVADKVECVRLTQVVANVAINGQN